MCGNVWEWVSDWYGADYYGLGETRDPRGPGSGDMRIVRGGVVGERRRVDAAVRVPAQGAARHVRVQHRIQNRMRGLIVVRLCSAVGRGTRRSRPLSRRSSS